MEFLKSILLVVEVVSAVAVIVLVLLQQGKGADMGAAFGSGSAGSLFGASGSANFLSRSTAVCATIFFCSCLGLAFTSSSATKKPELGVMSAEVVKTDVQAKPQQGKPVIPE